MHLRNLLKHLHNTAPVRRLSLVETGAATHSKTQLLEATQDATFRLAPRVTVRCSNLKQVIASAGCRNMEALERSLSEAGFEAPELWVGRFRDCIAEPRPIRLVTNDSVLVSETSSIHDILDPDFSDSGHLTDRHRHPRRIVRSYRPIDEDVLFVFNSFTPSYGHFVLTSLPLIASFMDEIKQGRLKIVVPAGYPRWMRTYLLEFGLQKQHLLILPDSAYRFRSAVVSDCLDARNTRAPNPETLSSIIDRLRPVETDQLAKTKLFVKRSGAGDVSSRTILNENDVIDAVESLGFRIIEPSTMSLRDQAHAFHNADIIVSPHGSTLANLIFCRPGAKVLDLMPDDWVGVRGDAIRDVWGLRVCAMTGLDYSVLLCPSTIVATHYSGSPTIACNVDITDLIASIQRL